jgi:hypothetical protein
VVYTGVHGAEFSSQGRVPPNPSLQPTVTGMALGPRSAVVHHAPRGPSAMPLPAAELER